MNGFMRYLGVALLAWTVAIAVLVLQSTLSEAQAAEQPQQCARPHVCV